MLVRTSASLRHPTERADTLGMSYFNDALTVLLFTAAMAVWTEVATTLLPAALGA